MDLQSAFTVQNILHLLLESALTIFIDNLLNFLYFLFHFIEIVLRTL